MNDTTPYTCLGLERVEHGMTGATTVSAVIAMYLSIPMALFASFGNGLALYGFATTTALQTASNLLLAYLAVTDLLTGTVTLPLNIVVVTLELLHMKRPCILLTVYKITAHVLSGVSVFTLSLLSFDRCLSICYNAKYRSWNMEKIYKILYVLFWLTVLVNSLIWTFGGISLAGIRSAVSAALCISIICIVVTTCKIYAVIRSRTSAVQNMMAAAMFQERRKKERRAAKTLAIILGTSFLCFLPRMILMSLQRRKYSAAVYHAEKFTALFAFLNSSLNPIIYYRRNKDIRSVCLKLCNRIPNILPLVKRSKPEKAPSVHLQQSTLAQTRRPVGPNDFSHGSTNGPPNQISGSLRVPLVLIARPFQLGPFALPLPWRP